MAGEQGADGGGGGKFPFPSFCAFSVQTLESSLDATSDVYTTFDHVSVALSNTLVLVFFFGWARPPVAIQGVPARSWMKMRA